MSVITPDSALLQHEIEKLAVKAGRMILRETADGTPHRGAGAASAEDLRGELRVRTKSGRRDLVTSMDLEIQKMLVKRLDLLAAPCSFLCEEELSLEGIHQIRDPQEIRKGVCFIIDPIDGTANFVHGIRHSCTSIAMTVRGETMIGVIYDPYREELFSACKGRGAWLNGHRLPSFDSPLSEVIAVFGTAPYDDSTNEMTFRLAHCLYELSADVRRTGSAALDLCWTACGRFGLYAELGLSAWDFAAGKLIAEETGCRVTDIDGNPLSFDGKPSILCGRPAAVKEFRREWAALQASAT